MMRGRWNRQGVEMGQEIPETGSGGFLGEWQVMRKLRERDVVETLSIEKCKRFRLFKSLPVIK